MLNILSLAFVFVATPAALASELDPVVLPQSAAPHALLIKADDQDQVVKAYQIQVLTADQVRTPEDAKAIVEKVAVPENEIALSIVTTSELDRDRSTQAWWFNGYWGWNLGWVYNPGWNVWYGWNTRWNFWNYRWSFFW